MSLPEGVSLWLCWADVPLAAARMRFMDPLLSTREAVRFDLVRRAVSDDETLSLAYQHALKLSAHTLGVARVGLWLFEDEQTRIHCVSQYSLERGSEPAGEIIELATCPHYAEALRSRRVVAADHARSDPRTAELLPYLEKHGIYSMLDSPVFRQGESFGIVCHEQVGAPRSWSKQDCHFVATVADMLGLYCEQRMSQHHYQELMLTRRALEEHRVMESLGRFSAAIAHDFNNVLAAIGLQAELAQSNAAKSGGAAHSTQEILSLVEQGARLVRQLFEVANNQPSSSEVTDLDEVAHGIEPLLGTFKGRGIRVALRVPPEKAPIHLERSRAEQVLMNLVVNARDALIGGGDLTVEVAREPAHNGSGPAVVLRVSDTGVGMDEQTRERMFEPFFTTKPEGLGQGLGLATVYRIVHGSGGTIDIRSEPGAGTDFTIRWPAADAS
jgi:signal transduction histidine kinase